jgi:hypothetical protein
VSPGVDGTVETEGEGEGAGFALRGEGGSTRRFGVSIKRGCNTPAREGKRNERTGLKSGFGCQYDLLTGLSTWDG